MNTMKLTQIRRKCLKDVLSELKRLNKKKKLILSTENVEMQKSRKPVELFSNLKLKCWSERQSGHEKRKRQS